MVDIHLVHSIDLADRIRPVRVVSACGRLRLRADRRRRRMVALSELELVTCDRCREVGVDLTRHRIEAG